ncbi:protein POLR1D-like isoform X1 [Erpetoichthys calabaricus]|uniref:Si:ch211-140b10.6 n=1 Tax=Erpetoichthys calabaricus TaxID=27687 RepID=A0A8C4SAN4_ERPCA|nr:protein POLR1D-like isoform X1 [Erpetoichthys calabaricus]
MDTDQELEKKAVDELLREANRGRIRAETMGPSGWMKCPLQGANKRFLLNTLRNTFPARKPTERKQSADKKSEGPTKTGQKKDTVRKHSYHAYKSEARSWDSCSSSTKKTSPSRHSSPSGRRRDKAHKHKHSKARESKYYREK